MLKSSRQLVQEAKDYRFNPMIPLKIYLRTCVGMLDKAQMSVQCGDTQMAFVFYYRYVDLCTNKLSRHPQCLSGSNNSDPEVQLYKQEYLQLIKLEVPAVLKLIEDLQKNIDMEYNKHQLSLAKNIAKPKRVMNNSDNAQPRMNIQDERSSMKPTLLPQSFNEHRFNQSIAFLNPGLTNPSRTTTTSPRPTHNINNDTNNTARTTTNNNGNNNNNNSNNNTKKSTETNNESNIFQYPELPKLSFPTF